jgi:hypothetical protein
MIRTACGSIRRHIRNLPPFAVVALVGVGQIVSLPDLVSYEEYCQGTLLSGMGGTPRLDRCCERCAGEIGDKLCLSWRCPEQGGRHGRRRNAPAYVAGFPHVRRAALIGKMIDLKNAEAARFTETFDGFSAGVLLVDGRGHVHPRQRRRPRYSRGWPRLTSNERPARRREAQINKILYDGFAMADQGDVAPGFRGIALPLQAPDGERYVAHLLPLTSHASLCAGVLHTSVAALFVRRPRWKRHRLRKLSALHVS